MQIVIEIPKEKELIDKALWNDVSDFDKEDLVIVLNAIANGTPLVDVLDKIRAEIEEKYPSCQCTGESTGYAEAVEDFLQIFDKYKAESEE